MNDLISRKAALDACHDWDYGKEAYPYGDIIEERLRKLPSVQPDVLACGEGKLKETAQQWIPVKYRPMTEEEREYWSDVLDYELDDNSMFDCQMPDDGQKILVCSKCGNIWIDTHEDDGGLMGLEGNGDWEGIVAWMPLPEPFKEVE